MHRLLTAIVIFVVLSVAGVGAWWLITHPPSAAKSDKPPAAATVAKVVKEDDLNTITLTEDAEKRIGLKLGMVEKKTVPRLRVYGGEVTVPIGRSVPVAAPLAGVLKA